MSVQYLKSGETIEIVASCIVDDLSNSVQEKMVSNGWTVSGEYIETVKSPIIENILMKNEENDDSTTDTEEEYSLNINETEVEREQVQVNQSVSSENNIVEEEQVVQNNKIIGVAFEDANKNGEK